MFRPATAGTFLLVTFGCGSIAQSVLSLTIKGDFFSVNWGWSVLASSTLHFTLLSRCVGAVLGVLLSSEVSGGHINPAVTVALATLGKFPWSKVITVLQHYAALTVPGAPLSGCSVHRRFPRLGRGLPRVLGRLTSGLTDRLNRQSTPPPCLQM